MSTRREVSEEELNEIITAAREVVPDILRMLQRRADEDPYIAVSALTMACATIVDFTMVCLNESGKEAFAKDMVEVKAASEARWKKRGKQDEATP